MRGQALVPSLTSAKSAIVKAEAELEKAIGEVRVAPRAEKVGISSVLETAFAELHNAKRELARIEALIAADDD